MADTDDFYKVFVKSVEMSQEIIRLKDLNRELVKALEAYMGVPTLGQCIDAENVLKKAKRMCEQ